MTRNDLVEAIMQAWERPEINARDSMMTEMLARSAVDTVIRAVPGFLHMLGKVGLPRHVDGDHPGTICHEKIKVGKTPAGLCPVKGVYCTAKECADTHACVMWDEESAGLHTPPLRTIKDKIILAWHRDPHAALTHAELYRIAGLEDRYWRAGMLTLIEAGDVLVVEAPTQPTRYILSFPSLHRLAGLLGKPGEPPTEEAGDSEMTGLSTPLGRWLRNMFKGW